MDDIYSEIIPSGEKAGLLQVFEVLTVPSRVFRMTSWSGHVWLYPFVLVVIVFMITSLTGMFQEDMMGKTLPFNAESGFSASLATVIGMILAVFIIPPAILLAGYILPALIYLFFENFVLGGEARFRQVLNVTAYASVPVTVSALLGGLIRMIFKVDSVDFSPAVFLSPESRESFLGLWLGMFDLFTIWILILTVIGLSVLYNHSRARTVSWLIPLYVTMFTIFAVFGSFMSKFIERNNI